MGKHPEEFAADRIQDATHEGHFDGSAPFGNHGPITSVQLRRSGAEAAHEGLAVVGPPAYVTKDSGTREDFSTGSRRDTRKGKGRFDLISVHAERREAQLLERGADKYGERNWEKGQPFGRCLDSVKRHLNQYLAGDRTEDHLAAIRWGAGCLIHFEEEIAAGRLPESLMDLPSQAKK